MAAKGRKPARQKARMAPKVTPEPAGMLLTATEFAHFCKVSTGLVTSWCDDGMPCDRTGRMGSKVSINLRDAVPWIVQKRSARSTVERDRVAAAQADRIEMANLKERRQLIDAGELQNDLLRAISDLAQDLDSVGQRVTTDEAIQGKIENELRIARNRFAEHLEAIAGPPGQMEARGRKNPQARATNARPVGRSNASAATGNSGAGAVSQ
jgi:hypothetical protein